MACSSCNSTCDSCSCLTQVKGKCVFYQGANLSCLDVTKGDDYDSILVKIDELICDIPTPSGLSTSIDSCNGNIVVTENAINDFTICLNPALVTQINSNTSNISTISACVENSVNDLVSDTIVITEESVDVNCGRTLRIEIPTPSGIPSYDGIVYNNTDKVGTSGAVGDKTLKSFNWNYATDNLLSNSDEIRIRTTGQIYPDGSAVDEVKLQLFDSSSSSILWEDTFSGFDKINKQSWSATLSLVADDVNAGTGLLSVSFLGSSKENGIKSNPNSLSKIIVDSEVSGIDYSNLAIKVIYVHNSTSISTHNFARNLMVEVRKFIG